LAVDGPTIKISPASLIAFAIASYFQYDTLIVAWLTGFYPNGQIGL